MLAEILETANTLPKQHLERGQLEQQSQRGTLYALGEGAGSSSVRWEVETVHLGLQSFEN